MLNVNELRVGNMVLSLHTNGSPNEWVEIIINPQHIQTALSHPDWFMGIDIKKHWLSIFGLRNKEIGCFKLKKLRSKNVYFLTYKQYLFNEGSIKYVHQLQNLYFALTGKELTCKIK